MLRTHALRHHRTRLLPVKHEPPRLGRPLLCRRSRHLFPARDIRQTAGEQSPVPDAILFWAATSSLLVISLPSITEPATAN